MGGQVRDMKLYKLSTGDFKIILDVFRLHEPSYTDIQRTTQLTYSHIFKRVKDMPFIRTEKHGRRQILSLTESGRNIALLLLSIEGEL